jgi:hypothetical protein
MSSTLWRDKKPVFFLFTSSIPIGFLCMPIDIVSQQNGAGQEDVSMSPMHVVYTTHMRSVEVADQLWALYSTLNQFHKWWHQILFFLLNITIINMFIIYVMAYKIIFPIPQKPMTQLQFMTKLCRTLLIN